MSRKESVNKKIVCSLLIALLATSLVLVTLAFDDTTLFANGTSVLDVQIDGKSKLGVNEVGQYVASINGAVDSEASYVWSISPDDGKTVLTSDGYGCTVTFVGATLEPYLLSVTVSKAGAVGFDVFTVYDPVTLPDYHLSVASNPYNYLIAADGTGWYYVINGTSGQVITSGTNQTALEISTYAYGAGTVVLKQLNHNSTATVPANVNVIELYQDDVKYYGATYTFNGAVYGTSFNSTTFYVGATNVTGYMLGSWLGAWNTSVAQIIGNAAITWGQITNANATIQQLVALYESAAWLGAWNATVTDIIGDTAIAWSQITDANVTVNALISAYMTTYYPYIPNAAVGSYSYMISTFTNATNTYYQAVNGSTNQVVNSWTSTNAYSVFNSVTDIEGTKVHVTYGTYPLTQLWNITTSNHIITADKAILKLPNSQAVAELTTNLVEVAMGVDHIDFSGFELDGNSANNLDATNGHCGYGFYIRGDSTDVRFHDNYVHDCRMFGFSALAYAGGVTSNIWVIDNTIIGSGYNDVSFMLFDQTGQLFDFGAIRNYVGNGTGDIALDVFVIDRTGSPKIHGGFFQDNIVGYMDGTLGSAVNPYGHFGIKIESATNMTISGNILNGVRQGISDDIYGAGANQILNNMIYLKPGINETANINSASRQIGVYIATDLNKIQGNNIYVQSIGGTYLVATRGVYIADTADNNEISNNLVKECGSTVTSIAYYDAGGADNVFRDNLGVGCDGNYTLSGTTKYYIYGDRNTYLGTARETITPGQVLMSNSSGYWLANSVTSDRMGLKGAVALAVSSATSGNNVEVIFSGTYKDATYTWGVGSPIYVSNSTSGALTATMPLSEGNVVQEVARALTATEILFAPGERLEISYGE